MVPTNSIGLDTSGSHFCPAKRAIEPVPLFIDDNSKPARIVARPVAPILTSSASDVLQKLFLTCAEHLFRFLGRLRGVLLRRPLFEFLARQKLSDLNNANVLHSEASCSPANGNLTLHPNSCTTSRIVNSVTGCVGDPNPLSNRVPGANTCPAYMGPWHPRARAIPPSRLASTIAGPFHRLLARLRSPRLSSKDRWGENLLSRGHSLMPILQPMRAAAYGCRRLLPGAHRMNIPPCTSRAAGSVCIRPGHRSDRESRISAFGSVRYEAQ